MVISQGEVWWAEIGEPTGSAPGFRRPVVVVQSDAINRSRIGTVVCVPLTSNLKCANAPGNVLLKARLTGLPWYDAIGGNVVKQGVDKARELLTVCDPLDVCERAEAEFAVSDRSYTLRVFGLPIVVDVGARAFRAEGPEAEFVLTKTSYFSRLSILQYLLCAQKIPPTWILNLCRCEGVEGLCPELGVHCDLQCFLKAEFLTHAFYLQICSSASFARGAGADATGSRRASLSQRTRFVKGIQPISSLEHPFLI